ncbi:hypothetical protein M3Y99_01198400 [Aphelenchoides fujianensis]|nr:hypothetical protein M3Y99_01198400 [Aphelenchoides fujianensis]
MAEVVDEYVAEEKLQADLLNQLVDPRNSTRIVGSGNMDEDYRELERLGIQEFLHTRNAPLPRELREQLDRMQSNCGFGLFPLLSRAWLTVDTDLFLWNFENNKDLAFYDQITHTIVKIELARFLLVVATTVDVILLAVSFVHETEGLAVGPIRDYGDSNLYLVIQEIHRLPLDGGVVEHICCTATGRIFYAVEDTLFEVVYYNDSWSGRVFKKQMLTKGLFSSMFQVFSTKGSSTLFFLASIALDPIRQVVCDDTRHVLYVLTAASKLVVYDLGPRGDSFHQVVAVFGIDTQLIREIASIAAVPATQSLSVHLVATLQSGYRVFFTCWDRLLSESRDNRYSQESTRPTGLTPIHFRYAPPMQSQYRRGADYKNYFTKIMNDVTVLAFESTTNAASPGELLAFSTANFPNSQRFVETKFKLPVQQPVWTVETSAEDAKALAVAPEIAVRSRDNAEIELVPAVQPRSFCRQHAQPVTRFFAISADGVNTFAHLKPVQLYRRIFEQYGSDSKQMHGFVELHGPLEICEMALRMFFAHGGQPALVANMDETAGGAAAQASLFALPAAPFGGPHASTPRGSQAPTFDLNLSGSSIRPAGALHSTPNRQTTPVNQLNSSNAFTPPFAVATRLNTSGSSASPPPDLSRISFTSHGQPVIDGLALRPSNRSRALFAHFSRIICGVWNKYVCRLRDDRYVSGLNLDEVRDVLRHLVALIRVVEGYSLFPTAKFANDQDRLVADAMKQEERSVRALLDLMQLSKEYLCLWQVLLENDFHAIIGRINEDLRHSLSQSYFCGLVTMPESVGVELISGLVRYYLGDDANTALINERLGGECPRLFTNDDANVLKATELLFHAAQAKSLKERNALVQQALETMKRHAKRVDFGETAKMLKEINYYKGIAELALACAMAADPRALAVNAYHRKMPDTEDGETRLAIHRRNEIYKILVATFEYLHGVAEMDENVVPCAKLSATAAALERDTMARVVMEGGDELCKMRVFQFLVAHQLEAILVGTRNPSFEEFICREIKNGGDARCHDLLWRYYKGTEEFAKAARLLYELATKSAQPSDIHKKMAYLSQALVCINSAPETQANTELKMKIRDWLDVAQVQRATLSELENKHGQYDRASLDEAMHHLGGNLMTANDLMKLANNFDLPLIKLAVFHCAGHYDQEAIAEIYKQIINEELNKIQTVGADAYAIMRCLAAKIVHLKRQYEMTPKFFPHEFIIRHLLHFALHDASPEWLLQVCKHAELSMVALIDVASRDFRIGDPFWKSNARARKFMHALFVNNIYADFQQNFAQMSGAERKLLKSKCLDFNADLLMNANENDEPTDQWETITAELQAMR